LSLQFLEQEQGLLDQVGPRRERHLVEDGPEQRQRPDGPQLLCQPRHLFRGCPVQKRLQQLDPLQWVAFLREGERCFFLPSPPKRGRGGKEGVVNWYASWPREK